MRRVIYFQLKAFLLLELYLSLALGAFIITGTYLLLNLFHWQQIVIESIALVRENIGFASLVLEQEVRLAGYAGCVNLSQRQRMEPKLLSLGKVISSYQNREGNQGLALTYRDINPQTLVTALSQYEQVLTIQDSSDYTIGEQLWLSDCQHLDPLRVERILSAHQIEVSGQHSAYFKGGELGKVHQVNYSIKTTSRLSPSGQPIKALFRDEAGEKEEEIAPNIADWALAYGVKNAQDKVIFLSHYDGNQIQPIVALRIRLLLTSIEPINLKPMTIHFNGLTYTAPDRAWYRPWELDIALPNQAYSL